MDYRHELKFEVTDRELEILRCRLKPLLYVDEHHKEGTYIIRSLYFDDFYDSCMRENEDGIDNRKKYRIRIYNGKDTVIKLEKKIKYRGMTRKESTEISKADCLCYMEGRAPDIRPDSSFLEKEFYVQIKAGGMRPVSIVEYERTAFVEKRGNVRITFDRNISGSEAIQDFLQERVPLVPLLPKGCHVLEVKYDALLPQYLAGVLEMDTLQRCSFSKYYYARDYKN